MTEGVASLLRENLLRENLLREKTRPPGTPRTAAAKVGEVMRLTQDPPPRS